ncbi:MAG: putative sensor histidine kinase NtrY-like protein [Candidatus Pelagibacterales bacterium]|nr:MAG: putative sensor histidine kinase NtrY-like protein [Pelagibacterales bacterium]
MNNKYINISVLNLRIVLLILGSLIFIGLSFVLLFYQRTNTASTLEYSNIYILFAALLTLILIFSLIYLLFPIYLRVRRKKISTLNSKFTLYFILIALTPSIFLGIIGLVLINFGINDWFNSKINNVINNSVFVAESYLEEHKETIKGDVYAMYNDLNSSSDVLSNDNNKLAIALRTQSLIRALPEVYVITRQGTISAKAFDNNILQYSPPENSFVRADAGEMAIMSSTIVNKVYALVKLKNYENSYLFAGRSMDANVISALNDTVSAKNEYTFLENNRDQISLIFVLIYVVISLILILLSTFIGLKFAEKIVLPLSMVIKATNNISKGKYEDKIEKTNDYVELNRLAESFNKMSADIIRQRKQILISEKHETWSDIARKIAHEIKNPLTPIQLSSERLEKKIKNTAIDNNEITDCIDTIRRQVNEIGYLVDEFSNFARLPNPILEKQDIYEIIIDIVNDYKNNYKMIDFEYNFSRNKYEMLIDKSQISRVFQNLIINSIHSIQEANVSVGKIIVESSITNNYLNILILDNGVGLKYEKNELIKPYFTTKKRRGGSGLGLAIVEKILFDHNAEFFIENRNDGTEGAKVEIKFDNKI